MAQKQHNTQMAAHTMTTTSSLRRGSLDAVSSLDDMMPDHFAKIQNTAATDRTPAKFVIIFI